MEDVLAKDAVAIVGIGCRFPGDANSPNRFWKLLCDGVDAVTEMPPERFDLSDLFDPDPAAPGKLYTRWGGFLNRIDAFDAEFFGIAPREARRMDPQQRLLLEVAWEALEDAGLPQDRVAGANVGVFIGIASHDYSDIQVLSHHRERIDAHLNAGGALCIAANRISYVLDLRGPSLAIDTACSSSLTAVHLACRSMAARECDFAIVGGVNVLLAPEPTIGFCKATMLSPDGKCHSFDAQANGYVRGEGAGAVILKPLARALTDRDPIYAVIRGSAINQDGRTPGMSLPSAKGQEQMLRHALRTAGIPAAAVQYVEAHGTGTVAGDPVEAEAIGKVFSTGRGAGEYCLMGSVKTNFGHLEAGAGIAGLIKTALALKHRKIPPSLHFKEPNPAIPFEDYRLRVPTTLEPWPQSDGPAMAGVNSFGFGGANAHVLLEEPPVFEQPSEESESPAIHVLTISARSTEALHNLAGLHAQELSADAAASLHDICYTSAVRRSHHEHRLAVVADSREEMVELLAAFRSGEDRAGLFVGRCERNRAPRLAFVFTGMGPQWWKMGRQLLREEAVFRTAIEEVDTLLRPLAGWSLLEELAAEELASRIAEPYLAHVANFAVQFGIAELLRSRGVVPDVVVGHSSGEMGAACAAAALSLSDAVLLAFHRGRLQQRTAGTGRMLAAGITAGEAEQVITGMEDQVSIAAFNGPASVTLSGDVEALERIAGALTRDNRFCRFLPVDVPYHSPQMDMIREELFAALDDLNPRPASIPLVSVATGEYVEGSELDSAYWWRNVREPVHFAAAIDKLADEDIDLLMEIGPHPVLSASIAECFANRDRTAAVLPSLRRGEDETRAMLHALAALHVRGLPVQWSQVYRTGVCVTLPAYPWRLESYWFEFEDTDKSIAVRSAGTDTGHPVLGRRLASPHPVWEKTLGDARLAYVDDHVLQESVVFPGAGYVEMMLAAARRELSDESVAAERIEFRKLLFLAPRAGSVLQLLYDPEKGNVEIHSAAAGDNRSWTLHATAVLKSMPPAATKQSTDLNEIRSRCSSRVDVDAAYDSFRQRGLRYGPAFVGIRELWSNEGESLGRIALDASIDGQANTYGVHPALLDAAFQVILSTTFGSELQADGPLVPTSIARIESHGQTGAACWAHAVLTRCKDEAIEGDVRLLDDAGNVLVHCQGLRLQALAGVTPRQDIGAWLYEMQWEESPLPSGSRPSAGSLPAPSAIAATVRENTKPADDQILLRTHYDDVEPTLNRIALYHIRTALQKLGWTSDLDVGDPNVLAEKLGVVPQHRQFLVYLVGILRSAADTTPHLELDPDRDRRLLEHFPEQSTEFELFERCGHQLAEILRGAVDPRDVLFGDSFAGLTSLYRSSPLSRYYNRLVSEAMTAATRHNGEAAPLRILEIGGGTGGLTAAVLPSLQSGAVDYLFTDISPYFLARAREEFSDSPNIRFGMLDLEKDPLAQQYAPGSFDVVLGANVIHATADIRSTLGHLRQLLAPGGLLLLMELTRRSPWFDLIFGPLEGWWRFADHDLRPAHPLLEQDEWLRPLTETGFDDVAFLADPPREGGTEQSVILARNPVSGGDEVHRRWLVFADTGGTGARVAEGIRERGDECVLVNRGESFVRHAPDCFDVSLASGDTHQLLDGLEGEGEIEGVIHLWSLDTAITEETTAAEIIDAQRLVCGSALNLIQVLGRTNETPPDVWLVTSGVHAMDGEAGLGLVQAPLWGFGRVLRTEQPELHSRLIDLGPEQKADEVDALVAELYSGTFAAEIALRGRSRWACQMRRIAQSKPKKEAHPVLVSPNSGAFQLEIGTPGVLDTLTLGEVPVPTPAPGYVSIRVLTAGLNFRDVMLGLGILPDLMEGSGMEASVFSVECAGVILSCGEGVKSFRPGDEVIALAVGAMGSHAVAREELVVHKPSNLSFEEAATIPCVYLTAEYGLMDLARIEAGERVLIHAASGGVGHAAIQICQRAGVEIFATAGTPEKREYLRKLGIEHVMDSRTLKWADEVLERTGGEGVDVILNSLAGEAIRKGLDVLRPFGRFVEIGKRDIYEGAELGLLPFRKNLAFFSVDLIRLGEERPARTRSTLRDIVAKVADGTYPVMPRTDFDIAQAEQAFRMMAQARHIGKVTLTVSQPEYEVRALVERSLFRRDATYLITGGSGGLGLAVAAWMARNGARHLVLMSRSGKPKGNEDELRRLESKDATIRVVRGDVANEEDVVRTLAEIQNEMPPLRGVMHLAMVLDDAMIGQLDDERFRTVMRPKMAGAWNLHRHTAGLDLDHFVLFSSISAVIGHALQGNYAAANTFLDALAAYRRAQGLPGVAIGWGPIAEVGYVSRHEAIEHHLARLGIGRLAPDEALEALEYALRHEQPHLIAARLEWNLLRKWNRTPTELEEPAETADADEALAGPGEHAGVLTLLQDPVQAARPALLEAHLLQQVAKVLGTTTQRVDPERSLTEMGLDSLLAVELLTAIKLQLGVQLPVVKLLQGMSTKELVVLILGELSLGDPASTTDAGSTDAGSPDVRSELPSAADAIPLSFEQQRFWYLEQLTNGNPAYHLFAGAELSGPLDEDAFARSVTEVVRRHEMLRACFSAAGGEPRQVFAPPMSVPFVTRDLRHLPAADRRTALQQLATDEIRKPFDLSQPPLVRVVLAQIDEADHVVLLVVHHIIADAWAITLIAQELMLLYDAFLHGRPSPLPQPTDRYEDYVRGQREVLRVDVVAEQLAYWKHQLDDAPALRLPTDHPRPDKPTFRGARVSFKLSHPLSEALHTLSRQEGVTLFMTLLAAFQTLLHRYTGQADISVGTPVALRNEPLAEKLIGCCMNTLVLRSDLSGDPDFRTMLQRVRSTSLGAFSHQEIPFERVVEAVRPSRDSGRTPLFQAMLILHNLRWPELRMEGLSVRSIEFKSGAAIGDLTLLVDTGDRLRGSLEYNADLFDAATIRRMLDHLQNLLEAIVADPDKRLSALPLLSDAEQHQLAEWNRTTVDFGEERCLHELFEAQADRTPDAVAVECGDVQLTYRELNRRADRLAEHLAGLAVGPDVVVGICTGPSPEMIVGMLGTLKAGGAFLPLDPSYPRERIGFMLRDASAPVLLTSRRLADALPDHGAQVVLLDDDLEAVIVDGVPKPSGRAMPDHLAYVMYTSGSTGDPKGVMITHRAICNQVQGRQAAFPLAEADVVLQWTLPSFDPAVWEFAGPLSAGARLVIPPAGDERDSAGLVRLITDHQVTVLQVVPLLLEVLLEETGIEACGCLKHVFCGGEPLTPRLRDRFCEDLPDAGLHNLYGPTEAAIDTTCWTCRATDESAVIPIGRPVANVQVHVLSADRQPQPIGVPGELYIGGPGLARGFLNQPELTADRFVPHPFSDVPGARLYRTGDLVRRLPDGTVEWRGRLDDQVKIRGQRVEPGEIAAVLMRHPAVREAIVVDRKDARGDCRLVACIVAEDERDVDIDTLRVYLSDRLPKHMVPFDFWVMQSFPRLPNGKVDRRALTKADRDFSRPAHAFVAPRDEVESQLVRIWESFFPTRSVGVTDNFFDLGGHSLLAMRLMARVRQTFERELPLASLFTEGTVERLAHLLRQPDGTASVSATDSAVTVGFRAPLVALQPRGSGRPFFCAHPSSGSVFCYVDLAGSLGEDQPFYALQTPALQGNGEPAPQIEDMATEYLATVRAVQASGPYRLGGWSMGSMVAYEMACRLWAAGEQVALLALFDPPPLVAASNGHAQDASRLLSFAASIGLDRDHLADALVRAGHLGLDEQLAFVLDEARQADLIPSEVTASQLRRSVHVHSVHMDALRSYRPRPYLGPITLFRAADSFDSVSGYSSSAGTADVDLADATPANVVDEDDGWNELAAGELVRFAVPGDHNSILRMPHVDDLARTLKSLLQQVAIDARQDQSVF